MYRMNNLVSKTEPCGTPQVTFNMSKTTPALKAKVFILPFAVFHWLKEGLACFSISRRPVGAQKSDFSLTIITQVSSLEDWSLLPLQAAMGIAELITMAMEKEGLAKEECLRKIWMVDSKGLIVKVP